MTRRFLCFSFLALAGLIPSCGSGEPTIAIPYDDDSGSGYGGAGGKAAGGAAGDASVDSSSGGNAGKGGSGGTAAGGAAGTGGGTQDGGDGSTPDVVFGYDAPVNDSDLNPDTACAASAYAATLVPLDMYVMIDRSGSMVEPGYTWTAIGPGQISVSGGDCNYQNGGTPLNSKWCYAIYALVGYFKSASAAGNRVALQFYPKDGYNCTSADNNSLSTAQVGFQHLPAGTPALVSALNAADPLGAFTPTKAALYGIAGFTSTHQTQGRITIGILITDGVPNSCAPDDGATLGSVVQAHLQATGIKTYIIGMDGAAFTTIETIAAQGGAPLHNQNCAAGVNSCHYYNVGKGDGQVLIDVLHDIQQNAIGCTYALPTTDAGLVDPAKISVEYTPGGGAPQKLQQVAGSGQCAAGSWYYDNSSPPNIVLCPSTCSVVQADEQATVNILVACQGN